MTRSRLDHLIFRLSIQVLRMSGMNHLLRLALCECYRYIQTYPEVGLTLLFRCMNKARDTRTLFRCLCILLKLPNSLLESSSAFGVLCLQLPGHSSVDSLRLLAFALLRLDVSSLLVKEMEFFRTSMLQTEEKKEKMKKRCLERTP